MDTRFQLKRPIGKTLLAAVFAAGLFSTAACSVEDTSATSGGDSDGALNIYATTGYIADALDNIAPDADVTTLVGPGGDPHSYQPSTKDIAALQEADVVFSNGLTLETGMEEQLDDLPNHVALGEEIPTGGLMAWGDAGHQHTHGDEHDHDHEGHDHEHEGHDHEAADVHDEHDHDHESAEAHDEHDHEGHVHEGAEAHDEHDHEGHDHEGHSHGEWDPHIWNSTDNWKLVVDAIVNKLSEIDSANADEYKANADEYKSEIDEAAEYVQAKIDEIPEASRILITSHDAFKYFGEQFGIEIQATDIVSSEAEKSAAELNEMAKFIASHEIKTIFQDNLGNPQAITSLQEAVKAEGWDVTVSDAKLYAGSLGTEDGTDTYIGVLKHNADTIADALK